MKLNEFERNDIQLVALMIARLLRTELGIEPAPGPPQYKVVDEGLKPNGYGDLQVRIKIDRGVSINVRDIWPSDGHRGLGTLHRTAGEMALLIGSVLGSRAEILEMLEAVRSAARRKVSKARRRGLPYRLLSVEPSDVIAYRAQGIHIKVKVEVLSEYLRPQCFTFEACVADTVSAILAELNEEQSSRAAFRAALDSNGATGVIDPVVVNALREAGHNVENVLARLGTTDKSFLDVGEYEEKPFRLYWRDGRVFSSIQLGEGVYWSEGKLSFSHFPFAFKGLDGRLVREVFPNPVFGDDVRIKRTFGDKEGYGTLYCTQPMLHFNSETGRMWAA